MEYLGYQVYKPMKMIRLYTAFAELGDLRETVFSKYNLSERRRSRLRPHVPTIAILYFFEAMAAGVCLMAHGQLPLDDGTWPTDGSDGDAPSNPWTHNIVHQDIKDGNYFLSRSTGSATWPGLPVLKLGVSDKWARHQIWNELLTGNIHLEQDFGNAFDVGEFGDKAHPRDRGTPFLMAPEQVDTSRKQHPL